MNKVGAECTAVKKQLQSSHEDLKAEIGKLASSMANMRADGNVGNIVDLKVSVYWCMLLFVLFVGGVC